jgi:trans-aconitate methyltransferase
MAEDSGLTVLSSLIEVILPLVPGVIEKLTTGIEVLDIGCGRGRAVNLMAEKFPKSMFTGYDLSEEAIAYASATARENNLTNARFETRDLTTFDIDAPKGNMILLHRLMQYMIRHGPTEYLPVSTGL